METQDNQNFIHESDVVKTLCAIKPLTLTETLDRIVLALELEGLKVFGSRAGNCANIFDEVVNINYCPAITKVIPSLKKNFNKMNKDTKSDYLKVKEILEKEGKNKKVEKVQEY